MNKKTKILFGIIVVLGILGILGIIGIIKILKIINNQPVKSSLYNGDDWANYRLGDVFYQDLNSEFYDLNSDNNVLYHKNKYAGTIANEYINKNNQNNNYKLLQNIIESRITNKNTYPDTLFLHIRVGDVLCVKDDEWLNKVNGPLYYSKVGDTNWWNKLINYIKDSNIKRVVIISGSHMNKCLTESVKYIEDRKDFLISEVPELKVEYRLGQSPDDDIILVYYVKHFITTGGGYGNMIKEIKK
jgi:hypothetical protein